LQKIPKSGACSKLASSVKKVNAMTTVIKEATSHALHALASAALPLGAATTAVEKQLGSTSGATSVTSGLGAAKKAELVATAIRMHPGAHRHIVLDFGRSVCITDIFVPACFDLSSVSVESWLEEEGDISACALTFVPDISTRSLAMCNLYPPVISRYVKVSHVPIDI